MESKIFIHLGDDDVSDTALFIDTMFDHIYTPEWIMSDYGRKVVQNVDKSEVLGEHVILSPVLGSIPPMWLSGGTKTLIAAYFNKDWVFPFGNLGDNCAHMLYEGALEGPTHWSYMGYHPKLVDEQVVEIYGEGLILKGHEINEYLATVDIFKYHEKYMSKDEEDEDEF